MSVPRCGELCCAHAYILVEQLLRRRIAELQEYRRAGVTTAAEAEVYDAAKAARVG